MSNLKPLVWTDNTTDDYIDHRAQGAGVSYRVCYFADKFRVYWVDSMGGSDGNKEFDSLDELKHWVNTDHYPHKMQPYVMPSPTWFNYETEKPTQGDSIVIAWVWMGDKHTIWLESYRPAEIDYLDDCLEVYWSFSPFVKQGE